MPPRNEEIFNCWAPVESPWSGWAKPVLFAQCHALTDDRKDDLTQWRMGLDKLPSRGGDVAVVVEVAGGRSVIIGLELARKGFRPVPLFNATDGPMALVDVEPIARALGSASGELAKLGVREGEPPAFLLDADRMHGSPVPNKYDNRSVVLPQDFPSGTMLRSRGINEVLVLTASSIIGRDLEHVLLRWQEAGLPLKTQNIDRDDGPKELRVTPPSMFRKAWYRWTALLGLRRNNVGGFGGTVPEQTSGGYG